MKSLLQLFCEQSTWNEPFRDRGKKVMQGWNNEYISNKSQRRAINRTARLALHAIEQEMIAAQQSVHLTLGILANK